MTNALINIEKNNNIQNSDWTERMNAAVDYIELNLTGDINIGVIASKAYCTEYHFTRIFSFIAGFPLNEYIRNRRLTMAGFMLQRSNMKVIDIANLFGYTSPNSFTRAFYAMNGIIPSKARDIDVILKSFPRLYFTDKDVIQDKPKLNFQIVHEDEKIYFGKSIITKNSESYKTIPEFWDKCEDECVTNKIVELGNGDEKTLLKSIMQDLENDEMKYMICLELPKKNNPNILNIFETIFVPKGTWAVFPLVIENPNEDSIISVWKRIWAEQLMFTQAGFKIASGICQERYRWGDNGKMIVEAWVPVIKNE